MERQPETQFDVQIPPELEAGAYANFLVVWHTAYEFTLDFAVTQPAQPEEDVTKVPCRVVARVKIPPTLVFEVLKALNSNMTQYEESFGEIERPERKAPNGDDE